VDGWKKLNSKVAYKCPYFWVTEDDVIQPSGKTGVYHQINTTGSVSVITENQAGEICLIRQTRYTADNQPSWEVPAGGMDGKSSPLENAKRELQEETGITAVEWISLGDARPFNGLCSEINYFFLARNLSFGKSNPDQTEDITITQKKIDEIKQMINRNQITDGQSITALCKYILYKENQ